jgi:hypothetical protein
VTGDDITHRILVTATAAYTIKHVDAEIGHRTNSGVGILPSWLDLRASHPRQQPGTPDVLRSGPAGRP